MKYHIGEKSTISTNCHWSVVLIWKKFIRRTDFGKGFCIKVSKNKQQLCNFFAKVKQQKQENKQQLWNLKKLETSLYFTVLFIKNTNCIATVAAF